MKKLILFAAAASMLFSAGCVSTKKYKLKTDEAVAYQTQAKDLAAKLEQANSGIKDLTAEKAALQLENDNLSKRIKDLEANNKNLNDTLTSNKSEKDKMIGALMQNRQANESRIRDLEEQIASLQAQSEALKKEKEEALASVKNTYDNLVAGLQTEIEQGAIQITQLEGKLTVNMVDRILFDSGQAEVSKQGRKTLDNVGKVLMKVNDKQIRVEGHTDNVPISKDLQSKYASNWELSASRATNVARYLIDKTGIQPKLISIAGYADTRPVAANETPEGKAKNRRIEIVLIPLDVK